MRKRRRRSKRLATVLTAVLVLGICGTAGLAWFADAGAKTLQNELASDFQMGQIELEAGKALLLKANTDRSLAELTAARVHFEAADAHFTTASARVRSNWLINAATSVSYVGTRVHAADAISEMGISLSKAALDGVDLNELFLKPSGGGTADLVPILRHAQPTVLRMQQGLIRAKAAADSIVVNVLSGAQAAQLETAKATIAKGLVSVGDLLSLIPAALEIVGANGPRTYLIEQVDPAELRAGGGFIGTYSVLGADQGKLSLVKTGSIDSVDYPRVHYGQPGYVAPPPPLNEFIGGKSWVLGDSNFFPDFVTNAQAGEMFAKTEIGIKSDGVISIDPYVIADMLAVTGPIAIPEFGVTVQSGGFVNDLFEREENSARQNNRKDFIGLIATRLFEKIASLPSDRWPALVSTLNNAAATRHLQVYFNNPDAEAQMNVFGWSGVMNPQKESNFFYEVESNLGATKANFFLQRTYDVTLTRTDSGMHVTVFVFIKDPTPPGYNGGRVYACYMRLYVPGSATNFKVGYAGPNKDPDTNVPAGYKLMDGWFQIDISPALGYGTYPVQFDYDLPFTPNSDGLQQVYWQKQPGTPSDPIHVTWKINGHDFTANSDLSVDRQIILGPTTLTVGSGQAATAHLPSLSL
jgi:Protein of unknown function (DUF4012)